ncbi:MAG: sensor domain-containing diguanylate cyclase [Phycisphaerae bacterium]|nr:sensor domain-containing diguanylate cyclase [Phycisphaerae bacterium]
MLEQSDSENLYRALLDRVADGVYFVDTQRQILFWNKAAEQLTGYSSEEVLGSSCADNILMHVDDSGTCLCQNGCPLSATMQDGQPREADVYLHHRDGYRLPVHVTTMTMQDRHGRVYGAVETFRDNTTHMSDLERIQKLEEVAFLDPLTGLANRRYLDGVFVSRFAEHRRHDMSFGVILADVDHFKQFNDTHGHDVGDQVLQMVAQTFAHNCRPYDIVGRWGGEEFLVIAAYTNGPDLHQLADRLRVLMNNSRLRAKKTDLHVTASFGATMAHPKDDMPKLIQRVDALLYRSKAQGRDRVTFEE